MAEEKAQYITFKGAGLDSDDAEAYMGVGDSKVDSSPSYTSKKYGGRRNVIPSSDDGGKLETALGNALIDDKLTPTATTTTALGYATDHENDKVYALIQGKNTGDNTNSILEFDPLGADDETAFDQVIWEDAALEFEEDKKIKGAEVIDGWIYYNGGTYGLKKVNITFAKNYTDYAAWAAGTTYATDDIKRVRDGRIYTAAPQSIVSSTNATPIVVTITAHGYSDGDSVTIAGHETNTAANGTWTVTYVNADSFSLDDSTGNGIGGATGTCTKSVSHVWVTDEIDSNGNTKKDTDPDYSSITKELDYEPIYHYEFMIDCLAQYGLSINEPNLISYSEQKKTEINSR